MRDKHKAQALLGELKVYKGALRAIRDISLLLEKPEKLNGDFTLVPNSALRWLFGEEGDFTDPVAGPSNRPRPYWWRSEFRKKMEAER